MNKKIVITLTIIVWAIYAIGNTLRLNFPNINVQSFGSKFSLVHFVAPGNNFVGSLFRLPSKSVTGTTISMDGTAQIKTCTKQIRGIYFNSQRGKRLRPIDQETRQLLIQQNPTYENLIIEWWLYTSCEQTPYSIFGSIKYTRWGKESYIVAGTKLMYNENKTNIWFAKSFQYFDNKVPIGYIYDSNGGIGFVGWSLTGHEALINFLNNGWSINSGFTYSWSTIISNTWSRTTTIESWNNAMETMWNLIIQWSVGLSKSITEAERLSLLGNFQNKTVIYNGSDINSSTLINIAKQKAQALCQGKTPYTDTTLNTDTENILCIQNHDLTIDLSNTPTYANKTIIIKSGNVILQNSMDIISPALDLFVDKGRLYLPRDPFARQSFNNQWFPDNSNGTTSWLYLKWNFIINGLMLPTAGTTWFNHKLHLQGKITLLNTPLEASTGKISQITDMFWSDSYNNFINLQKVFTRTCRLDWTSNDGTPCSTEWIIATTPLVIVNGNYPSNILQ